MADSSTMELASYTVANSAGGFALTKALSAVAGLFGGLSVSFFWQPKKLHEHGKLAAGAIVGGIAVGAAFTLGGIVIKQFGLESESVDIALGVGYIVGILSVGFIGLLANFFEKREGQDLLQVAQEVKSQVQGRAQAEAKPAVKRPAAKRATASPPRKPAAKKPAAKAKK